MLAAIDWTPVLVVLIGAVPSTIAALASLSNRQSLKTPSGTSIGKQVESAHHVALGNNYRLRAMAGELGGKPPEQARSEEKASGFLEPDGED